ncbi:MAG: type II secretion system minor pseudopilin GspI [Hellea sp.]|nr:type II secretion system minor pseudopilin GspI [Hellea sp.]
MRDAGFTLVEVLAALMIFSVAIVGLISVNAQSVRTVRAMEVRMLAGVVADNVIVEARRKELQLGENDGEMQAMGRRFEWEQDITVTEMENFFRIMVRVREADKENFAVERIAFRSKEK